jgi:TonB family protein
MNIKIISISLSLIIHLLLFLPLFDSKDFSPSSLIKPQVIVTYLKSERRVLTSAIPIKKSINKKNQKKVVKAKKLPPPIISFKSIIKEYIPPEYPKLAIRKGIQGVVAITLDINKNGNVDEVEVSMSSNSSLLDESVIKAAKLWTFKTKHSIKINKKVIFKLD